MGSCFSKPKEESWDSKKTRTSGNSRFTSSEQKLGNKVGPNSNRENHIDEKQTNNIGTAKTSTTGNQGRTLGGQESGNTNPNSREAVAKAAELRYHKQKEQLKESQDKLKSMSKKSKKEKGLQV